MAAPAVEITNAQFVVCSKASVAMSWDRDTRFMGFDDTRELAL
jgi:hypothetical protein